MKEELVLRPKFLVSLNDSSGVIIVYYGSSFLTLMGPNDEVLRRGRVDAEGLARDCESNENQAVEVDAVLVVEAEERAGDSQ